MGGKSGRKRGGVGEFSLAHKMGEKSFGWEGFEVKKTSLPSIFKLLNFLFLKL